MPSKEADNGGAKHKAKKNGKGAAAEAEVPEEDRNRALKNAASKANQSNDQEVPSKDSTRLQDQEVPSKDSTRLQALISTKSVLFQTAYFKKPPSTGYTIRLGPSSWIIREVWLHENLDAATFIVGDTKVSVTLDKPAHFTVQNGEHERKKVWMLKTEGLLDCRYISKGVFEFKRVTQKETSDQETCLNAQLEKQDTKENVSSSSKADHPINKADYLSKSDHPSNKVGLNKSVESQLNKLEDKLSTFVTTMDKELRSAREKVLQMYQDVRDEIRLLRQMKSEEERVEKEEKVELVMTAGENNKPILEPEKSNEKLASPGKLSKDIINKELDLSFCRSVEEEG